MEVIENGKIASTFLGVEDHGIFTIMIHIQGDGWGQGFGGYALGNSKKYGSLVVIKDILDVFEIDSWEKLEGQFCRIIRDGESLGSKIIKIGNIMKDKWFSFEDYFAKKQSRV